MTPTLVSLKFAVGYACNRKCGFCLQLRSDQQPVLGYELVQKVLDDPMVKQDVRLITLTGGEPTYYPYRDLSLRITNLAKRKGMETCVFTNGDLLTDRMIDQFVNAGVSRFRVSIYDPINFDETAALMDRLKNHGLPAMAKYTVTRENLGMLPTLLGQLENLGVSWFQAKPYNRVEVPEVDARYELSGSEVLTMAKLLINYKRAVPAIRTDLLPLCYEFLLEGEADIPVENLSPCNCGKGPRGYLVIGPTGDIRICGAYPEPIGNAATDSITDLWMNHPLLEQVRNLAHRPRPAECADCEHWERCAVTDCHSATFAMHHSFAHGNPQCPRLSKVPST